MSSSAHGGEAKAPARALGAGGGPRMSTAIEKRLEKRIDGAPLMLHMLLFRGDIGDGLAPGPRRGGDAGTKAVAADAARSDSAKMEKTFSDP
jgi:hypothetical protein